MTNSHSATTGGPNILVTAVEQAVRAIPPAWPLASNVAVNPFLGQAKDSLAVTGARLGRVAGISVTMPRSWYREKIFSGKITETDLLDALAAVAPDLRLASLDELMADIAKDPPRPEALSTIADLSAGVSGIDWSGLIAERFGAWAAGYLDEGQALWTAPRSKSAYRAWRAIATHDLTPEIAGLAGFAAHVADTPETGIEAIARAVKSLNLPDASLETYLHQMLMTLGGWSQYARFMLWQAELEGATDGTIIDFLAIRLVWEEALFLHYRPEIADKWATVCAAHAEPVTATRDHIIDALLQAAWEHSEQRALAKRLSDPPVLSQDNRPVLQAAFCIDVRSEVFRRALESMDGRIQTLGFAGFFGLTTSHRRFASDVTERRLPVLLNPAFKSCSGGEPDADADLYNRVKARAKRAWGRFKLAAVSSFAFVEATGPVYIAKLLSDSLGQHKAPAINDPPPRLDPSVDLETKIKTATSILCAMSFTKGFARLVLLVGHGASVVNNPHASALHCGACGGYPGDVNARLLASLLNDPDVRTGLASNDITIPSDTVFLAALHNTTTDKVTLFKDNIPDSHSNDIRQTSDWLASAGRLASSERALRLPKAANALDLARRSRDWAQTRPEWALAGCKAFIAAPRYRTTGKNLKGRVFLHDYDWNQDEGFRILELIMTAPVVVASWISLQYYGSTVAPDVFGGGNKLLHNIVGGIGVVEGNGGLLRAGLPWQSVHDGEAYVHAPLRLSVCIEAPREAITDILRRHADVRSLFDNGWLQLIALNEEGRMAWRYAGNLDWNAIETPLSDEAPPRETVAGNSATVRPRVVAF